MSGVEVSRVGVDVDSHDGYRFLITYLRAMRYGDVSAYYTRHGFHVDVELKRSVSVGDALVIRGFLGDDPDRLAVDEQRVRFGSDLWRWDTLFEVRLKGGETYARREFDPVTSVSLPRLSECSQVGCSGEDKRGGKTGGCYN